VAFSLPNGSGSEKFFGDGIGSGSKKYFGSGFESELCIVCICIIFEYKHIGHPPLGGCIVIYRAKIFVTSQNLNSMTTFKYQIIEVMLWPH
jgi:hypothetical protein